MRTIPKKAIAISIFFAEFFIQNSSAQIVRLFQGFDNYAGTSATVPAGWYISWNSTSPASFYTTATNYATSSPSYGFGINQDTVISPYFQSGDVLWFWCKGQGAPFSVQNTLRVYTSADSITWNTFQTIDSLPVATAGVTMAFNITCSVHYLKFIYTKVNANLAFDDVKVTMTDYFPVAAFSTTQSTVCSGDSICFSDSSSIAGCDSICSRVWDFGDGNSSTSMNPCHYYILPGTYVIWLYVTACNGNTDSVSASVTVNETPLPMFGDTNITSMTVNFTDSSSISGGSITNWYWDFGDATSDTVQNPTHVYSSVGNYYVCLTVTSNAGCSATYCDSVSVIDVGIAERNLSGGIFISPNPASNILSIGNWRFAISNMEIFDVMGQRILSMQFPVTGQKQLSFDVSDLFPGIYFLRLSVGANQSTTKVVIAR